MNRVPFDIRSDVMNFKFEDLPTFWRADPEPGALWRAGFVNGDCDIEYESADQWHVGEIRLEADNCRHGGENRSLSIKLDADDPMYALVKNAIEHFKSTTIEERLAEEGWQDIGNQAWMQNKAYLSEVRV